MGDGVCGEGEYGGGVGGTGIHGNPWLINYTVLCGEAYVASSSSLRGCSISRLYSRHVLLLSLNNFPLCLAPNIKVVA